MDTIESTSVPLSITPMFAAAVQITRPKSASKQGSLAHSSPVNQIKVAKLVLKPAPVSISNQILLVNKPSSPQKRETTVGPDRSLVILRLNRNNNQKIPTQESSHEPQLKKHQQTVELETKMRKAEKEKKALNASHSSNAAAESSAHNHKSTALDEAARREAREFMKKQREKRKLEKEKDVDKSFIIRQRLDELRKTTRNVITKKAKKNKSQIKISPPRDLFSIHNHMKEIKVLKLKPMSAKIRLPETTAVPIEDSAVGEMIDSQISPVKCEQAKPKSPAKTANPIRKPMSPLQRRPSPLQVQNHTLSLKPASAPQSTRPSSSKENKKPHFDLNLKVPDVKLSMSGVNKAELLPATTFIQPKVPFWLQNTAVQPYPYNFIWAVRKKLEAYTSAEEKKQKYQQKFHTRMNLETPQVRNVSKMKKGRKLPEHLLKFGDENVNELQRPTLADDSETNTNSVEREMASEANTYSEISSIKSDLALVKSKSQEKERQKLVDEDDTTISESIFHSLIDDKFVGKKRESVNSEFSRTSFNEKVEELLPEHVSPNTTEKRNNFFSSTLLPKEAALPKSTSQADNLRKVDEENDLSSNKLSKDKEEEYQKMLTAFNQSLSHVIQVNNMLMLSSKSSIESSKTTSATVRNYSSSFENNIESDTLKTSADSNISEMIENLVHKSNIPATQVVVDQHSETNSSIKTFIEDSKSIALKPEVDDAIEDPPIVYNEPAQEFSSSSTKVTTTTTTKIVQQKVSIEKKEDRENTLNESKLLNMFKQSDSETSFNIVDNNASFGTLMDKSSSEIKSWERTLTERTRGQIAWLELQKQNLKKHGQVEKVSAIKKQQRAILLRLEREKEKLRENSERSLMRATKTVAKLSENVELSDITANESLTRENIQKILQKREEKLVKRRAQVEHLIGWQRKLDKEEEKLRQMEQDLLGNHTKKTSGSPKKKKTGDVLNHSFELAKSIDKSLRVLEKIESAPDEEAVEISGAKLNKLWHRLTGVNEKLYQPLEIYHLNKRDVAQFYEEAKEVVLQSDLKMLLETSVLPQPQVETLIGQQKLEVEKRDDDSDVSTMNSIANIETEEEFPGSQAMESKTVTVSTSTTKDDDELHQLLANQMKVFVDARQMPIELMKDISYPALGTPTIDNATFKLRSMTPDELDVSASTADMDIEKDSLIQTEPLVSIDSSSVDAEGFIIPELNSIQVTDMDQDDDSNDQLIEDISFPNLEISMSDETLPHVNDDNNRNDLSTITECTEYEASQGSSNDDDEISSEIVSYASTATTSERVGSEVEKRLISINDSLEEVNEAFKNIAIINQSSSTVTYSTDKDFVESPKASTSDSNEKSHSQSSRMPSTNESFSTPTISQITTSTPKVMPDIISEVSSGKTETDDF